MNIENINILINTFKRLDKAPLPEHPEKGFNMSYPSFTRLTDYSGQNCGTAACISAWKRILNVDLGIHGKTLFALQNPGCCSLDINPESKYHYLRNAEKFTLRAAIRVLEILRDTGKVDWNEAIANPWTPENEKPKFNKDDWLNAIVGKGLDDVELPFVEGPKRVVNNA